MKIRTKSGQEIDLTELVRILQLDFQRERFEPGTYEEEASRITLSLAVALQAALSVEDGSRTIIGDKIQRAYIAGGVNMRDDIHKAAGVIEDEVGK